MTYLAFDLGAESGRAMVGHIENGRIALRELHRFPNRMEPLHGHSYWDLLHLFAEILHALRLNPPARANAESTAYPLSEVGHRLQKVKR